LVLETGEVIADTLVGGRPPPTRGRRSTGSAGSMASRTPSPGVPVPHPPVRGGLLALHTLSRGLSPWVCTRPTRLQALACLVVTA